MCRLDLLDLQCRAWTGRLAAVVYVPLMGKRVVSWNERVDGSSMHDIFKVLSQFYDDLDPMSAHLHDLVLLIVRTSKQTLSTSIVPDLDVDLLP